MKKRILLVIGVLLLIGLAVFGLTHRFVVDVTVNQGVGDDFLRDYPALLQQVTALRNSSLEPGMQVLVNPLELYTVYTVTEKSVLRGTRVYHLLSCSSLTLPEAFSPDQADAWTAEFRVLADVPDAGFWVKSGAFIMDQGNGEDIVASVMELDNDDYLRANDAVPFASGLQFEAPFGKRLQAPVVVSLAPYLLDPPATNDTFHEGSVQWNVKVRIGCFTEEMRDSAFIQFPAQ